MSRTACKQTGLFLSITAGALFLTLLPFILRGNPLGWTDLGADGLTQHATFLEYMFHNGLLFNGGNIFDYNFGLGADALTSMAYYMMYDPINLLLYILPRGNFLAAYSALTVIKLLITAAAMYVYLGDKIKSFPVRVSVSVAYMLSGFVLYTYLRHPDLAAGAMYLPLVVLGIENVLNGKNPFVLVFSAFVTLISNFYMFYMVSVFVVLYAVIYYFCRYERAFKPFMIAMLKTAGWYLLGILSAAFLLLPTAYGYVTAARSASKGFKAYGLDQFIAIMATFFIPSTGPLETPVMFTPVTVALALAACTLKKARPAVVAALILTVAVLIPLGGYTFNLFNYVNNRFVFLLTFSVLVAVAYVLDAGRITPEQARVAVKGVAVAMGFILTLSFWFLGFSGLVGKGLSVTVLVLAVPVTGGYLTMLYTFWRRKFVFAGLCAALTKQRLLAAFSACALLWAVVLTSYYSAQFNNAPEMYSAFTTPAERYVATQSGFNRVDYPPYENWFGNFNNRPVNNDIAGTFHYNTVTPASEYDFVTDNGAYNTQGSLGMSGLNGRRALQAVLGVNYYLTDGYVPHGFTPVDGYDTLYTTTDYLPFGTVFSRTMSDIQYKNLPIAERQNALLDYIVLENGDNVSYIPAVQITHLPDGTSSFSGCGSGGETYIGFEIAVPDKDAKITIRSEHFVYTQMIYAAGGQFYSGQTEYLYNLGETSEPITVTGDVRLTKVYSAFYPFATIERRPHLENTVFTPTGFTGTVTSESGYMLIPLSYSAGFTATVDGQDAEVLPADGGLMAIRLPAGTHTVSFSYRTPGFEAGTAVSVAAVMALITAANGYYLHERRKILLP